MELQYWVFFVDLMALWGISSQMGLKKCARGKKMENWSAFSIVVLLFHWSFYKGIFTYGHNC